MIARYSLIAFIGVLATIVLLTLVAAVLAYLGRDIEALGVGAAVTGLIGVLGTFRPRHTNQNAGESDSGDVA